MAHIGHPLLGDGKYGVNREDRSRGYKYQALYAYRLRMAFGPEENALSYLRGKEFRIPMSDIWFLKDFEEAAKPAQSTRVGNEHRARKDRE
jgi:23S rRNA pseudouridine955/2504/2580 synthase